MSRAVRKSSCNAWCRQAGRDGAVCATAGDVERAHFSLTLRSDGVYRDARQHITPELEARLDAIARSMREFYYGRFALRFASLDELMRGENFSIVEIDGVGGADSRCCDPPLSLAESTAVRWTSSASYFSSGTKTASAASRR